MSFLCWMPAGGPRCVADAAAGSAGPAHASTRRRGSTHGRRSPAGVGGRADRAARGGRAAPPRRSPVRDGAALVRPFRRRPDHQRAETAHEGRRVRGAERERTAGNRGRHVAPAVRARAVGAGGGVAWSLTRRRSVARSGLNWVQLPTLTGAAMPETTSRGRFVWHDLLTTDPDAATPFDPRATG